MQTTYYFATSHFLRKRHAVVDLQGVCQLQLKYKLNAKGNTFLRLNTEPLMSVVQFGTYLVDSFSSPDSVQFIC